MEQPQQLVATNAATLAVIKATYPQSPCVAIAVAPGANANLLATNLTVPIGTRELLLSACFANATTVSLILNGASVALLQGATFGALQLYGPISIPVEPGDAINFQIGTGNDNGATKKFKVEGVAGW